MEIKHSTDAYHIDPLTTPSDTLLIAKKLLLDRLQTGHFDPATRIVIITQYNALRYELERRYAEERELTSSPITDEILHQTVEQWSTQLGACACKNLCNS